MTLPEKYVGGDLMQSKINFAYVTALESFAKEMAEVVAKIWTASEFAECLFCAAPETHIAIVEPYEWRDTTKHVSTCPVLKAREYLNGEKAEEWPQRIFPDSMNT